jgi:hypothetical protein
LPSPARVVRIERRREDGIVAKVDAKLDLVPLRRKQKGAPKEVDFHERARDACVESAALRDGAAPTRITRRGYAGIDPEPLQERLAQPAHRSHVTAQRGIAQPQVR